MPIIYNRLPKITAAVRPSVGAALAKTAFDTETLAKFNAPVDTGNLKNSIMAEQERVDTWRVYANADYAIYVELGHQRRGGGHQPGRFYLNNALAQTWGDFTRVLKGSLGI